MSMRPGVENMGVRLPVRYPYASVEDAYRRVSGLMTQLERAISHAWNVDQSAQRYETFETQFRVLHKALTLVVIVTGEPIFIYKNLGLRVDEEAWLNPPTSTLEALEELQRPLSLAGEALKVRRTPFSIPDYAELLDDFREAHHAMRTYIIESLIQRRAVTATVRGIHLPRRATEEKIQALGERPATDDDEGHCCSICIDDIVAGQRIRILSCSHCFHTKCIDAWLRINGICPIDRIELP